MKRLWSLLCFLSSSVAIADESGVALRDLPPLPVVNADDSATSSVALVAATEAGDEVVVGAAKREQSLGTVASAVTVLSGDRLRRFGYRTVAEALRSVAGLFVVDDRMTERLGIRGLQILGDFNTRILVLIDGATLNEPWNQFVGIGADLPVAIDDVERIEIVRGPVSSVYGTNAFFGIINIVTLGADRASRVYGRATGSSFGSYGGTAGFAVGNVHRQLRGSVLYQNRLGEAIDIDNVGHTDADGVEAMNASLVGHWDGAFAQMRAYRKVRELAGAPFGSMVGAHENQNTDQMFMLEGGYSREVGPVTLTGRAYFNRYQYSDYLVLNTAPNFRDIGDSTWIGAEARAHLTLGPVNVTAGFETSYNDVRSRSFADGKEDEGTNIPTEFHVEGFYGEVEWRPLSWLSATGGLRFDLNSIFDDNISPRVALLVHDGERMGLKFLFARGFRNPSPIEAFFQDNMSQIANPALKPERIASYEAVAWARPLQGLNLRLSGFWWDLNDILALEATANPDISQFQNIETMRSIGFEAEVSYRDTRGFYAFATAAVAIATNDSTTEDAKNAPAWVATLGVSSPRLFDLLHVSTELQLIGARHTLDPMRDATAHARWNVAIYLPRWKGIDATIGVRNLIGVREDVPASSDFARGSEHPVAIIPGEGREFYARLGYSL